MNTLEISNLTKSFGNKSVLNDVALMCQTGEIIGLFGRNGSGKSTLLQLIFGTLKADAIKIQINSEPILPRHTISSATIAYLPQDSFLPKGLKVRDVIPLFFENDEQDTIFYAPKVAKFENTTVGKLSMGELRYLEILLVANLKHPFLMLDEPFSMVEPLFKDLIKQLLAGLKETKGILLTDHYYDDVLDITTRNLIIKDGSLLKINSKNDLIEHHYLKARFEKQH